MIRLLLLLILFPFMVSAQWHKTQGAWGGTVNCFAKFNNAIYCGTTEGLYRSDDFGNTWSFIELDHYGSVSAMQVFYDKLYISIAHQGALYSTNGISFLPFNKGLSTYYRYCGFCINNFHSHNGFLYAMTGDGLYKTSVNDTSWQYISYGFFDHSDASGDTIVRTQFTRYGPGVSSLISYNLGASWNYLNFPGVQTFTRDFASSYELYSDRIFAVVDTILYESRDQGTTWNILYHGNNKGRPVLVKVIDDKIWLATNGLGVFTSPISTINWTSFGLTEFVPNVITKFNHTLFAGDKWDRGIASSDVLTPDWKVKNTGLTAIWSYSITSKGYLSIAGVSAGIFISKDGGENWRKIDLKKANSLDEMNRHVIDYIATDGEKIITNGIGGQLFYSPDTGNSWTTINSGLAYNEQLKGIHLFNNKLYLASIYRIVMSPDNGATWTTVLTDSTDFCWTLAQNNTSLFTGRRILRALNIDSLFWSSSSLPSVQADFPFYTEQYYCTDSLIFAFDHTNGLYTRSLDGNNWNLSLLPYNPDGTFVSMGSNIGSFGADYFLKKSQSGLFHSTDHGNSWSSDSYFLNKRVYAVGNANNGVLAIAHGTGIMKYGETVSSVKENKSKKTFKVYPNPGNGFFRIESSLTELDLEVVDASGRFIESLHVKNGEQFNVSGLRKGLYFFKSQNNAQKVIITH